LKILYSCASSGICRCSHSSGSEAYLLHDARELDLKVQSALLLRANEVIE
jgi:hypothetical protein